ncbi:MAG: hypothetical protein AAFQ99_13150, partial [Pseudomonadota bacterium]
MKWMKRHALIGAVAGLLLLAPGRAETDTVEVAFEFGADTPPGNIAVGPDGRIFMSVHGFYGQPLRVVEVNADGSTAPYPTAAWARAP